MSRAEEWMGFDVRGTGTGPNAAKLVFDEEFADEGFAKTSS